MSEEEDGRGGGGVSEEEDGRGGGGGGYRTKNKNPTRQCGEQALTSEISELKTNQWFR